MPRAARLPDPAVTTLLTRALPCRCFCMYIPRTGSIPSYLPTLPPACARGAPCVDVRCLVRCIFLSRFPARLLPTQLHFVFLVHAAHAGFLFGLGLVVGRLGCWRRLFCGDVLAFCLVRVWTLAYYVYHPHHLPCLACPTILSYCPLLFPCHTPIIHMLCLAYYCNPDGWFMGQPLLLLLPAFCMDQHGSGFTIRLLRGFWFCA